MKPQLDANNVRMIGVGLEELGVEQFVEGKFWAGELYIDTKKQCYKDLGFKRLGFFGAIGSILGKKGREMLSEAKKNNIAGDMKGDGFQNGGTIIVSAGGKEVLLTYAQDSPADHVPLEDVLKALGIQGPPGSDSGGEKPAEAKCDENSCQL